MSVVATGIEADQMQIRPLQDSQTLASQSARKPFGGPLASPRPAAPVSMAPRERSAAEIVRQAVGSNATQAVRQAAPVMQAAQPVIRVIDEVAQVNVQQQQAYAVQQAAVTAQSEQLEHAMRIAATAARPAVASTESAGPLFVSPRAEVPQQRTLFSAQSPEMEEETDEEDASGGNRSLFNRLANVGKSIAGGARPSNPRLAASATAPAERKAEVRETAMRGNEEEELYDIPAFLRRQAN